MRRDRLILIALTALLAVGAVVWFVQRGSAPELPAAVEDRTRPGEWPDATTAGVPAGVSLRPYDGPCTITESGTVIEGRSVSCPLLVKAADVVIRMSKVTGTIKVEGTENSLRIEDSTIDGGEAYDHTVGFANLTVVRSDISGAQSAVNCSLNCLIQDSYLHSPFVPEGEDWHLNAFLSNGGSNIKLIGNTLRCEVPTNSAGGGCSSNASIFGDLGPNSDYVIQGNLFAASDEMSYCFYGGYDPNKKFGTELKNIVVVDNVFERGANGECASFGTVTSFDSGAVGNEWRNNKFSDGEPVEP